LNSDGYTIWGLTSEFAGEFGANFV
jgi:hypothetical protein